MMTPFNINAPCFKIDVTSTASASRNISTGTNIRLVNDSYSTVFVSIGEGSQTATIPTTSDTKTCIPILGGSDVTLNLTLSNINSLGISAICKANETSTLYVQVGEGV